MPRADPAPVAAIRRKLVIIGDGGCGKTCLLTVFTLGSFPTQYIPTVFESYVADCLVDGKLVELALWDTAGQEDYERLRPLAYSGAHIIVLAFAINRPDSLENAKHKWIDELKRYCPQLPVILVGLKQDLRDDAPSQATGEQRSDFITPREGATLAKEIGAKKYLECSALSGEGVDDVFEAAARLALLQPARSAGKGKSRCIIV